MADDLDKKIVQQIEYYFGNINLPKDKFLQEKIKEDDGWVTLEVLLTFKRLASLTTDIEIIASAIEKSENKLVVLSEDRTKLRRSPEFPTPEWNEERREELLKRTAYAKGFAEDETLDEIEKFLDSYGPIESCLRRTYLDKKKKQHTFKGSCFIIFKDEESCKKFIEAESVKYKEVELIRKFQKDYFEEKKKEAEERKNSRKNKKETKEGKVKPEKKKIEFPKGASLHFSGIQEGQMVTREEIKDKLKDLGDVAYLDFSKGDLEGHIRMQKENDAAELYKKLADGKVEVGDIVLTLRVLEGEEEEKYLERTAEAVSEKRQRNKQNSNNRNNRKRKGNFAGENVKKAKVD